MANLLKRDTLTGAFWFSAYIAFCAGTVILVFLGHNMHSLTSQRRQDIWKAAQNCCSIEKKLAPTNRLARRYAAALEVCLPYGEFECFINANLRPCQSNFISVSPLQKLQSDQKHCIPGILWTNHQICTQEWMTWVYTEGMCIHLFS